jgi:N6-L-threonylcarbamoyladenine synthase
MILALETSCDESAVALFDGGHPAVSLVASQIELHRAHGGVVPELASRNHALHLRPLVEQALAQAGVTVAQIEAFAATRGPGLASSLLIGHNMAKGLALAAGKPFLSVNHMEGHLLSPFLSDAPATIIPRHLALVVSGGHTLLVEVGGLGRYRVVGRTIDDAAGEAFDKVARMLGLPYPGGPEIEKQARTGDPDKYPFPRSLPGEADFSFSGLKTAVLYTVEKIPALAPELPHLCASFQQAVIDVLVKKSLAAAERNRHNLLTLSGGVACNNALREALAAACAGAGLDFRACPPDLSTDTALMIAYTAWLHLANGHASPVAEDIDPNLSLTT